MSDSKACSRCKQILPIGNFNKKSSTPSGYASACKTCTAELRRNMPPESRARKNAKNREYRANNPEAVAKTNHTQYMNKREQRIESANAWIKANPEKHAQSTSNWKKRNKNKVAAHSRQRRARLKLNGTFFISDKELNRLLEQKCFYCGLLQSTTVDHIISIKYGGRDSIGNIAQACKSCNSSKRELTIMEWRLWRMKRGKPPLLAYARTTGAFRSLP